MKARNLLASSLAAILIACGGGGGGGGGQPLTGVAVASSAFDALACLSPATLDAVRASPEAGTSSAFDVCRTEFATKTAGLQLSDTQTRVAFAAILAHSMAPYGTSRSITLADLLADKAMDCDNYAIMTGHFARFLAGDVPLRFVGFDGGAVGNHAQLFFGNEGLLVDPTIGLIARVGFDELLMGRPVDGEQIRVFRQHHDGLLDGFTAKVRAALTTGAYRPSSLLYFFDSLDEYLRFSDEIAPLWTTDVQALLRRFPTPGALALRRTVGQ